MSVTTHEQVLAALVAHLTAQLSCEVIRAAEFPEKCPAEGVMNIRHEEAPELDGEELGTGRKYWIRPIEIDLATQLADEAAGRALYEALLIELGAALLNTETLGGTADAIRLGVPDNADDIAFDGTAPIRGSVIPVDLYYTTSTNSLEIAT